MDKLSQIVLHSQEYLSDDISYTLYRMQLGVLIRELNDNELKALAHLISEYAIHLRDPH